MKSERNIELMREQPYAYWLHSIQGIGNRTIQNLLSVTKTAENTYYMTEDELKEYLRPAQLNYLKNSKKSWNLYTEYEKLEKKKIHFYTWNDPEYPDRLRNIPDAPYAIYVRGRLPKEYKKTVAVIGARLCSEYGRYVAGKFAARLASAGIQVVSGLASGIDGISQKAVMEAGGDTFAVLGCGVDICYPENNREIYHTIPEHGGVLSEYIPGTLPKPQNFPPRNRIISGLSDAVLVIEAKQKSGTLITVDMALEQGKEVYVVPGRITDALSFGCNRLVKQGAGIVLSPEDLLQELAGMQMNGVNPEISEKKNDRNYILPSDEEGELCRLILKHLDYFPQSAETILGKIVQNSAMCGLTIPLLMQQLLHLQMNGYITQIGGQYCLAGK